MAYEVSTGTTSIAFGSVLKIGYRVYGSTGPYTYLTEYPTLNQLPYEFSLPSAGTWQLEYSELCQTCGGGRYSDPETVVVTVDS